MTTSLIIGGDLSSKSLALVAKHPLTPTATTVKYQIASKTAYKPADAAEALDCMFDYVESVGKMAGGTMSKIAYLEAPVVAGARNIQSTIKQSMINGVVQAALVKAGFTVNLVPVSTWKKLICGNGNADKHQVAETLRLKWARVHHACDGDQDLMDAACICLYGGEVERHRAI